MTGLVGWTTSRARMIIAFIVLSVGMGFASFVGLPKEGSPNIDVPILYISVPLPGVGAADAERLIVKPLETKLRGIDGLKEMTGYASQNHAGVLLEFEFGWDKTATLADVRDKVDQAQAEFPDDAEEPVISEVNLSQFPIIVVSLSGDVPERTLLRLSKDLQRDIESISAVLEASLAGQREEMLEVIIDPLKLESYGVTAADLLSVIDRNNQLVAGGAVESGSAAFAVNVTGSFETALDVYDLPVKVNGESVVRLGDVTDIRRTFEDAQGLARFNGEKTIALQVKKRIGENIIETVKAVRAAVNAAVAEWPDELRQAVRVDFSMDESIVVNDMVTQLQGSVLTAMILVALVVLALLGLRSAALVGLAIPISFLLTFALMSGLGMTINNMTMFGLILAVGMLVDGAIVVVEYADKRIRDGVGPMRAYAAAARRMFWPIVSSTATTLCAFLPMLLWPGMPGQFMSQLPTTLIFVLSASLIVALIYLPVMGGTVGRIQRPIGNAARRMQAALPRWQRALLLLGCIAVPLLLFFLASLGAVAAGSAEIAAGGDGSGSTGAGGAALSALKAVTFLATLGATALGVVTLASFFNGPKRREAPKPYRRTAFGHVVALMVTNPFGPFLAIGAAVSLMVGSVMLFSASGNGVEFFVKTEPERAIVYVRARGNLSLQEQDRLVRAAENVILGMEDIEAVFAFSGSGGLEKKGDQAGPLDAVGQIQIELKPWYERGSGDAILAELQKRLNSVPGLLAEIALQEEGPQQGKPIQLQLRSNNWEDLYRATEIARAKFGTIEGLVDIDDTTPLPGIEWEITVDRARAGRFGADVATVGPLVQLVTRGAILGTYRPSDSDEEVEIRIRFPENERVLATLDRLRVQTARGLVPLSNFISRRPVPKLDQIVRTDTQRSFLVRSDVAPGVEDIAKIVELEKWIAEERPFPDSVSAKFTGDREEQEESQAFLMAAFMGALGLMFIILLAQFNSVYNSVLVLSAVVMSVAGVMIGMVVMGQNFSIIMTGTGIVALAGIVVNNNIVLIDTFQDYSKRMPALEAIVRTAEARIRPVLLTTVTTMAGLTPMMFAVSIDFANGGFSQGAPTALWWTQLATAVVFGLGVATGLTLMVTPAALAARVWVARLFAWAGREGWHVVARTIFSASHMKRAMEDRALARRARRTYADEIIWVEPTASSRKPPVIRAAE